MISYVFYTAGRLFTRWATWAWISIKLLKCKLVCLMKAEAHASLYSEYERRSGCPWFCLRLHSHLTRLDSVENSEKIPFLFSFFFLGLTQSLQSCLTLCDPMDWSLPGSFVHGIFQGRILKWVVISSSRGSSKPRDWAPVFCVSCIAGNTPAMFCLTIQHVGFQFPSQGSNPCSLHLKQGVLTTGLPEKSPKRFHFLMTVLKTAYRRSSPPSQPHLSFADFLIKIFLMWIIFKVFIEFIIIFLLLFLFWIFGPKAFGILAPRPGIEPASSGIGRQSPNY